MKQNTLKFHIRQQSVHRDDNINLVIGNTPTIVTALFRFTSEWNVLEKKVAWFTRKSDGYIESIELQPYSNSLTTYTCDIPTSMLYNQGFSLHIEGIDETDDSNNLVTDSEYVQVKTSASPKSELKLFRHYGQIKDIDDNCIGYISFLSSQQAVYTSESLTQFITEMGYTAERSGFGYMQSDDKAYFGMSLLYAKDGVLTTVNCYKLGYDGPCTYVALKVVGVTGTGDDTVTNIGGESGYVAGTGIEITGLTISVKNYDHLTTDEQLAAKLEGYVTKEELAAKMEEVNSAIEEEAARAKAAENQLVTDMETSMESIDEALQQVVEKIDTKQDTLIAGDNITIKDGVISAQGGDLDAYVLKATKNATSETVYSESTIDTDSGSATTALTTITSQVKGSGNRWSNVLIKTTTSESAVTIRATEGASIGFLEVTPYSGKFLKGVEYNVSDPQYEIIRQKELTAAVAGKQDKLTAGTGITVKDGTISVDETYIQDLLDNILGEGF